MKVSAEWENKAKSALKAGNTELAKTALAKKVKTDEDVANYKEMYESISAQADAIASQVDAVRAKLDEAKSRQAMLIARSQMADTKKNLAQSLGGIDSSSSSEKFNRMEEKIIRKEAEADAFSDIAGTNTDNDDSDDFKKLETDSKVDAELQRLMAEMQNN